VASEAFLEGVFVAAAPQGVCAVHREEEEYLFKPLKTEIDKGRLNLGLTLFLVDHCSPCGTH
jgi:hypothetical protein